MNLNSWLSEWADSVLEDVHKGWSGINVVERILRDPGVATSHGQHRVLWWPKSRRVAKISKAAHQLTPLERTLLVVYHGRVVNDDNSRMTLRDVCENSTLTLDRARAIRKNARRKVRNILLKNNEK